MSLKLHDIVSIGGKPGLHKIVGKRANGLIVETMDSGKRFPTTISQKVSILSEISMYTYDGDTPLREVMSTLHEKVKGGLQLVTKKNSGDEIRGFFREVLSEFDENQVYTSDILKLVSWYQMLVEACDIEDLLKEEKEEKEEKKKSPKAKKEKEEKGTQEA